MPITAPSRARSRPCATRCSPFARRHGPRKGCLNYDLHVSPDDPGLLVFHENWESKEDLDAHLASAHIDAFRAVAPDLLAEPPDITLWTEVKG